jgi:hypothetical protein
MIPLGSFLALLALAPSARQLAGSGGGRSPGAHADGMFQTAETCLACHNGLTAPSGADVSIGSDWRGSMMANSARDPYWQASVRREILEHPEAREAIEDECATCHMPMARTIARLRGEKGAIFAHLSSASPRGLGDRLAHDGVSCTLCHQIAGENLGASDSFTGGYRVAPASRQPRQMFGPFEIDRGRTAIMRSATGYQPKESAHVQQSELCATCHTLFTEALGPRGEVVGRLPEQVPYLEWRHSALASGKGCQACHMPVVGHETPISSVLGDPREGLSRHVFVGGNFFVLRMLNRYRGELAVQALPQELDSAASRTVQYLQSDTARVSIERTQIDADRLLVDVSVQNLTGHKLPTGYPARRVWLHLTVRGSDGRIVFESGRLDSSGAISGNDSDSSPTSVEPHYNQITQANQAQIYEAVMGNTGGEPTTSLLHGVRFLKDNRLLPRGFDKVRAAPEIAVMGTASNDADFSGGGDQLRYSIELAGAAGPFQVDLELRFQPISFRWAMNLTQPDSVEARRFVRYYESMAGFSSEVLARASAVR